VNKIIPNGDMNSSNHILWIKIFFSSIQNLDQQKPEMIVMNPQEIKFLGTKPLPRFGIQTWRISKTKKVKIKKKYLLVDIYLEYNTYEKFTLIADIAFTTYASADS